jgi:hypothetical protein
MHSERTAIATTDETNTQSEEAPTRYFNPKDSGTDSSNRGKTIVITFLTGLKT